jgi:hypothetical protein
VATDYVLRLIDQIALMLAEILQLRKLGRAREAHDQIATACLQSVGLPLALVKHSAPETILEMLATGGRNAACSRRHPGRIAFARCGN